MHDEFIGHYIACMLWSSTDESNEQGGYPFDDNYSIEDIAPEAMARIERDCAEFLKKAESLVPNLLDDYGSDQIAHDFWLTRNQHGAGFWDGDYEEPTGTILTGLSKEYGSLDPYLGDDGLIYLG